jgi:hypothetical protein
MIRGGAWVLCYSVACFIETDEEIVMIFGHNPADT